MTTSNHNAAVHDAMNQPRSKLSIFIFTLLFIGGLCYLFFHLYQDITLVGGLSIGATILLITALLIALGFEFVNGFHDTANAVATVIYTHSLPPTFAVVWSGLFNFLGVLVSSGVVAYGIIALLPVELILNVGNGNGFAMVFALLLAAILWNLGTWYFGLPASSSHTLVGSIIGVGIGNAILHGRSATAGVDWSQVQKVLLALLISPLVGFCFAAGLLWLAKKIWVKNRPELFTAPQGNQPPPLYIRAVSILTCTGVSFAHGSNDGQKGMGLIMLILVGVLPMAYGVNHAITPQQVAQMAAQSQQTAQVIYQQSPHFSGSLKEAENILIDYVRTHDYSPHVLPSLAMQIKQMGEQLAAQPHLRQWDKQTISQLRNQMYLTSETIKQLEKDNVLARQPETALLLQEYRQNVDKQTKFIPTWVKIVVALALGLGTMVGWKRIVITVGEKIGKGGLTYAQGSSSELVAMCTIGAADLWGLPVSTTHVLSSGVAGTMVANGTGVQKQTLRNLLLAWITTMPAAMLLSGGLYGLLSAIF